MCYLKRETYVFWGSAKWYSIIWDAILVQQHWELELDTERQLREVQLKPPICENRTLTTNLSTVSQSAFIYILILKYVLQKIWLQTNHEFKLILTLRTQTYGKLKWLGHHFSRPFIFFFEIWSCQSKRCKVITTYFLAYFYHKVQSTLPTT